MKKNDLIKILQGIKGNPDIVLWNGFVADYQSIDTKIIQGTLVKQSLEHYIEMCRLEDCREFNNWDLQLTEDEIKRLKSLYKTICKWEDNQYVTLDDIKSKRYLQKTVYYLQAKRSNKTYVDRLGEVQY